MLTKVCFLSDLHLFCDRSVAHSYFDEINRCVLNSDVCILGGDIFDFKWSRFDSIETAVEKARDWLLKLMASNSNCDFHYLLGNHDCFTPFVIRLSKLVDRHENLAMHPHTFRMGDAIFLHGDVIDCGGTQSNLEICRKKWSDQLPKSNVQNFAYNLVVQTGVHKIIARRLNSRQKVAATLMQYLNSIQRVDENLRTVIYGHTHVQDRFSLDGIEFRNGGATIRGLPFEVVQLEITCNDRE